MNFRVGRSVHEIVDTDFDNDNDVIINKFC